MGIDTSAFRQYGVRSLEVEALPREGREAGALPVDHPRWP